MKFAVKMDLPFQFEDRVSFSVIFVSLPLSATLDGHSTFAFESNSNL